MDELASQNLDGVLGTKVPLRNGREEGRTWSMLPAPVMVLSLPVQCFPKDLIVLQLNTLPIKLVWEGVSFLCISETPDQDSVSQTVSPTHSIGLQDT